MSSFLIADDSLGKLQWLSTHVEKANLGLAILAASNTDEAKRLIDKEEIVAGFIDFEMPSEGGPAVMKYLREKYPKSLITCTTSGNSDYYRDGAASAGVDEFVCTASWVGDPDARISDLLVEWKVLLEKMKSR